MRRIRKMRAIAMGRGLNTVMRKVNSEREIKKTKRINRS